MQINPTSASLAGLNKIQRRQQSQFEQLSSGKRINSAKDDAAGLSISTRLNAKSQSNVAAMSNIMTGISRVEVEDAVLSQVNEGLMRIRELSVRGGSGILSSEDRQAIDTEINQNYQQIASTLQDSEFNGQSIFSDEPLSFQVGAEPQMSVQLGSIDLASQLQTEQGLPDSLFASDALTKIDQAIQTVNTRRSEIGAVTNRFHAQFDQLQQQDIQIQQSNSRIQDSDFAKVASDKAKTDIQQQVLLSVLGQANVNSAAALRLLKN